ncbi:MAG: type II toxin-antitoxin system VapC family toxin [Chloroflexota bacterium]|nr:type II toxin-antitoxin system VapC family toxin [Chloroflexota bacterium]MDE2961494.1 type II toxin-antitoxin system VapC family toxin [Chloroflexota bacterium]
MFLLDTDVLSSLRRSDRNPKLVRWVETHQTSNLHVSVVTIGEIERGIEQQRRRNPAFADELGNWLGRVLAFYQDRVLPVDVAIARRWGRLSATIGNNSVDLLIAATALEHGFTVVTRNVRHFMPTGVPTLNPIE